MSSASSCSPCCPTPEIVDIPGSAGATGAPGTNGINAFTVVNNGGFTVPNIGNAGVITVADTSWVGDGQNIFVVGAGEFQVISTSPGAIFATYLNIPSNIYAGSLIPNGNLVSPSGVPGQAAAPGSQQILVGAFNDPNGSLVPADATLAAFYYKDQASPVVLWLWSPSNLNWFVAMS